MKLDVGLPARQFDAFVVIVDGYRELLLRSILPDNILIQKAFDLRGLGKMYVLGRWLVVLILVDDVLANPDAFITDEDRGPRDQFTNIILTFVAE